MESSDDAQWSDEGSLLGTLSPPRRAARRRGAAGGKVSRIGFLRAGAPPDPHVEAFRQGLRELGYVEGQNIVIEYRWAEGSSTAADLAAELVRLKVDVIVTGGAAGDLAAKQATTHDPHRHGRCRRSRGDGLVASLARPGGNVTG